jgi:hypothetical protein
MFQLNDLVYRRDTPGKRGRVCEFCPQTGRIRVKWPARRTWNKPDALVKVRLTEPKPEPTTCPWCRGTGRDSMSDGVNWLPCEPCHGKGTR